MRISQTLAGLALATLAAGAASCQSGAAREGRVVTVDTGTFQVGTGDVFECFYTDTIADDDWAVARAVATQEAGGHHVTIYWTDQVQAPNHHPCKDEEMLTWSMVAGAGGEAGESVEGLVRLPEGYAARVPKGAQIVLQAHYINAEATPRTVTDVATIHLMDPAKVVAYANIYAMNDGAFQVPPRAAAFNTSTCRTERDLSVLILLGHMHEYGKSYKLERIDEAGNALEVLYETGWKPYYVSHPPTLRWDATAPLTLPKGTRLRQTCRWQNDTADPLAFPREMCTGVMYYFPDTGGGQLNCPPDAPARDAGAPSGDGGAANCVAQGDPGNEHGVGAYCDDRTACRRRQGGPILICTGAQGGPGQSFCTTFCQKDSDCGSGAYCMFDARGSGCVPAACGGVPGGGRDAGARGDAGD